VYLQASQSGFEAAKQSLDEHTKTARKIKDQTPNLEDGKASNLWGLNGSTSLQPNLSWVRTAAQAAVALQLHGVLETTGLPSASARLQHASLPNFKASRIVTWVEEDGDYIGRKDSEESDQKTLEESFEEGVLHVEDELKLSSDFIDVHDDGNGYDLLPLPVPAPERQILSVGEIGARIESNKETRFRYGELPVETSFVAMRTEEDKRVYLGEMAIDENIDKLRDVIGHVDNTLSRCLASGGGIEQARGHCQSLHLRILSGLDSWEGLSGKFVSQRALLKGITGVEQSREVFEESDLALIDGELFILRVDRRLILKKAHCFFVLLFMCIKICRGRQRLHTLRYRQLRQFVRQFVQHVQLQMLKLLHSVLLKQPKLHVKRANLQVSKMLGQLKRGRRSRRVMPYMLRL
jgi:hypothetical protein